MATTTRTLAFAGAGPDWTEVLSEVPLFAGLSSRHMKAIAKLAKIQRLPAYTKIVREGDKGDAFFLLLEGSAVVRPPGKRPVTLNAGDFFGELALLDGTPRTATVESRDEVLLAQIGRTGFLKMLEDEPKVSLILLRTLAARLRSSEASTTH